MMIEAIISMARYLSARQDDDIVDRMNYLYTPNMLLAFSVLISFKQFGGRPLECMFPNKFPGSWEQYAENYCWSEDTYYLPPEVHVASIKPEERYSDERKLSYYQWVPFFLLAQAACFRFPSFLWKCLSISSGICVDDIVAKAMDPVNMDDTARQRTIETLARHIGRALRFQKRIKHRRMVIHRNLKFLNLSYSACFISYMYLVTKLLYLLNVVGQLYLMNRFLETDSQQWYGLTAVYDVFRGIPWTRSGFFPRVSLCDFTVRQVGNIQKYSVQCVLVINIFNEKIFILLWLWYSVVLVSTVLSMLYWIVVMTFPCFGRWYVAQNLELYEAAEFDVIKHKDDIAKFVKHYLKQDGIFLLRMVSIHAGILFSTELVMHLYQLYFGCINDVVLLREHDRPVIDCPVTVVDEKTMTVEDGVLPADQPKSQLHANLQNDLRHRKVHKPHRQHVYKVHRRALGRDGKPKKPRQVFGVRSLNDLTTALIPLVAAGNRSSSSSSSTTSDDDDQSGPIGRTDD